jgi:hypothetical protein
MQGYQPPTARWPRLVRKGAVHCSRTFSGRNNSVRTVERWMAIAASDQGFDRSARNSYVLEIAIAQ